LSDIFFHPLDATFNFFSISFFKCAVFKIFCVVDVTIRSLFHSSLLKFNDFFSFQYNEKLQSDLKASLTTLLLLSFHPTKKKIKVF